METATKAVAAASARPDMATIKIGDPFGGGFYSGCYRKGDVTYALISADKATGEIGGKWSESSKHVKGAESYSDGMANTLAMAAAGSTLAQWALDLRIGGRDDWHIPSQDQLEVMYRSHKPTADTNTLYGRSGINVSAVPPTHPYAADTPAQTSVEAFQVGGSQAFEPEWYWCSTQRADDSGHAWGQGFDDGDQICYGRTFQGRARAVRSEAI